MDLQANGVGSSSKHEEIGKSVASSSASSINTKDKMVDGLNRTELVRLIIQSLQHMGYHRAAEFLEQDSGILLQASEVTEFVKCVLEGNWSQVDTLLPFLGIHGPNEDKMRFLIYSQKFLELLERRQVKEALNVLRHELTPLNQNQEKLHRLTSLIMCTDVSDLKRKAEWDGSAGESRRALLHAIRDYVSSTVMLPEHRLGELIKQAMAWQTSKCLYHNVPASSSNLFEDHVCTPDSIPRETMQILEKHTDEVWYIKFSHNGKILASASKDNSVTLWEITTGNTVSGSYLRSLQGHLQPVSFVSWSPDDTMLLSCSNDCSVRLWSVDDGSCIRVFKHHTDSVTACAWLPDGKHFVSGGNDKNIFVTHIDGRTLNQFAAGRVNDLCVTHDGKKIISTLQEKKIRIDLIDKSERPIFLEEQNPLTSMELSEDSRYLLVNLSSTSLTEIHLWDLVTQRVVQSFKAHNQKRFVIRSCFGGHNQAFVVSGSEDKNVYIWRRENGNLLEVLQGHTGTVNSVSWSTSNPYLFASASDDRTVRLWACRPPHPHANGTTSNYSNNNNNNHHPFGHSNGSPVQNSI